MGSSWSTFGLYFCVLKAGDYTAQPAGSLDK